VGFFSRRTERIDPVLRKKVIVIDSPDEAATGGQALELDEYHHAMRLVRRRRRQALAGIAIAAGALAGFLAIVIDSMTGRAWARPDAAVDVLAVIMGAFFGCLSALVVPVALWRKDVRIALPLVYGPAVGVVIAYAWLVGPIMASLPAVSVVVGLSALSWLCLPNVVHTVRPGRCHRCGYSLEGNATGRCPECGLDWSSYTDPNRIPRPGRLLGSVPFSRFLWRNRPGRIVVVSLIVLIVGVALARHTGPRFTYARFESIERGMTCAEVLDILGRADRIKSPQPRVQHWIYESGSLFAEYYVVEFLDGRVCSTDTARW